MNEGERLEIVRWHLARLDEQRAQIWNRASSVLSANGLVIAGAALLAGVGQDPDPAVLLITLLPIAASVLSVYLASQVLGSIYDFSKQPAERRAPVPAVGPVQALTVRRTFEEFRTLMGDRTLTDEIDDGVSELWRLTLIHAKRTLQMRRALRWFVVSVALLIICAVADVIVLIAI